MSVDALRTVRLFVGLGEADLNALAASAQHVQLPAGEWLFRQGDEAADLAIVLSGRLEIVIEVEGQQRLARHVGQGEALGELALLTKSPRSASARAVRDSELLVIPQARFDELLVSDAQFAVRLARTLASELRDSGSFGTTRARSTVFAVVSLTPGAPARATALRLVDELRGWGTAALLEEVAARDAGESYGASLARCEAEHDYVVGVSDDSDFDPEWRRFCVRSADRVIAIVHRPPPRDWAASDDASVEGCDLAVVPGVPASAVGEWMRMLRPRARHVLGARGPNDDGVDRMARRMTGRSWGLVLSGGGARGLAHLGVVSRLRDANVPIDRVGGCSMGAFVAVMYALGWPVDRMEQLCRAELLRRRVLTDLRVPRLTVLAARRLGATLERAFGDTMMEALPTEAFTVSADLVTGELITHRRGLVREAVAASMAVPGLVPPVITLDQVLVDGGVLDNLPVDVMDAEHEGPVIAVDVMRKAQSRGHAPGLVETMARAMVLGGWQRTQSNREIAKVLITPEVDAIGFLDFERLDEAIAAGRRAADLALPRLPASR